MDTPETPNFGFARVGQGETLAKNGYQPLDGDRVTLDALLYALEMHTHDASARLADPEELVPTLSVSATDGQLPGGVEFFYTCSLIDRWGLETACCTEVSVTTAEALVVDGAPAVTVFTAGGGLTPGRYSYIYTYVSAAGGETRPSTSTTVTVTGLTSRTEVDLPDLPASVLLINVYRSRDGQSQFFYIGSHDGVADYFTDTGGSVDYTRVAPRTNTTGGTNSVTVSVEAWEPGVWEGAYGWRIYRTLTQGEYDESSLVHEVVETVSEDSAVLLKTWIDDGDELQYGTPRTVSATVSGGAVIDMAAVQGSLPVSAIPRGVRCITFGGPVADTLFDGTSQFPKVYLPQPVRPVALQLSTTGVTGRTGAPVDVTLMSTGGAATGDPIKVTLADESGLYLTTWPLVDSVQLQGEDMTRSSNTSVLAVSDLNASSGMAVELNAQGEYVEQVITLEPGVWHLRVRSRFGGTSNPTDLHYQFWSGVGFATNLMDVAFQGALSASTAYTTVTPAIANGGLIWAGGQVKVRISKSSVSATTHMLDWVELFTNIPELPAGQGYIDYDTLQAGNVGTHHLYTLWF